jgi:uncharacterized protein
LTQPEAFIDSKVLKKYQGVYGKNPGYRIIIIAEKNVLKYEDHWGKGSLSALSIEKFISKNNKTFFTFNNKPSDSITGLKLLYSFNGMEVNERKVNLSIEEAKKELAESKSSTQKQENYGQFVLSNIINYRNEFSNWSWKNFFWFHFTGTTSLLFLTGMYAGKRRLFNNVVSNYNFFRKLRFWYLLLGIVLTSIFLGRSALKYIAGVNWKPLPDSIDLLIQFSWALGCVLMAIGIIAALSLAIEKEKWKKQFAFLRSVGRMGLTNYILGNLFYFLIFTKWGLNMSGKVGGFYGSLIVIPVCILIYLLSRWWLKHFKYGPFEWLWRSLTYLKFQPMRVKQPG